MEWYQLFKVIGPTASMLSSMLGLGGSPLPSKDSKGGRCNLLPMGEFALETTGRSGSLSSRMACKALRYLWPNVSESCSQQEKVFFTAAYLGRPKKPKMQILAATKMKTNCHSSTVVISFGRLGWMARSSGMNALTRKNKENKRAAVQRLSSG